MTSKIWQFLQDDTGAFSSQRLNFLVWSFGTLVVMIISFFKTGTFTVSPVIVGILATNMTGKVAQSISENANPTPTTPPEPPK